MYAGSQVGETLEPYNVALDERLAMIMRTWRGWTRVEDRDAYAEYILETGIASYKSTSGNRGAYVVSRLDGDLIEFLVVSLWEDELSIAGFAGDDIGVAVFYPEDDRFLVKRETTVRHYNVQPE